MRETISEQEVVAVAEHLDIDPADGIAVEEFIQNGNIHPTTVKITTGSGAIALQRINERVFRSPEQVASNMQAVCAFMCNSGLNGTAALELVRWKDGALVHRNYHGCWRATRFWEDTEVHVRPPSREHAYQAGRAIGRFHNRVRHFSGKLQEVIEGYHSISFYFEQLERAISQRFGQPAPKEWPAVNRLVREICDWTPRAQAFERLVERGCIPLRLAHRDSKLQNIAFRRGTPNVHGLLDWDTIGQGTIHLDLGDLLRSCCNPVGFSPARIEDATFDVDMSKAVVTGYLATADGFLETAERAYLPEAAWLSLYQHVLRYLADFLDGGMTFGVDPEDPEWSLRKARIYAQLLKSFEEQQPARRLVV